MMLQLRRKLKGIMESQYQGKDGITDEREDMHSRYRKLYMLHVRFYKDMAQKLDGVDLLWHKFVMYVAVSLCSLRTLAPEGKRKL